MGNLWPRYPLNERLLESVKGLFPEPEQGLKFLGLEKRVLPGNWYRQPEGNGPYLERVKRVKQALEDLLAQMAAENREYDNPVETERLRSEAVGILMALHEIWLHFPEVADPE
jgi:hypothetical protein